MPFEVANAKSTRAQIEKKNVGFGRFIWKLAASSMSLRGLFQSFPLPRRYRAGTWENL